MSDRNESAIRLATHRRAMPGHQGKERFVFSWKRNLLAVALLACVSPVFAQDSNAQLKAEVDDLRETVKQLQAEVKALKANQQQPPAVTQTPTTTPTQPTTQVAQVPSTNVPVGAPATAQVTGVPAPTLPARQSVSDNPAGASRLDNQAPPTDPELKGFIPIPGTDTMIRLGGYAKLDAMYDTKAMGNTDQFVTASIPVPHDEDTTGNFNMHARQTRFSFEVRRPSNIGGTMRFYLENDFFGGDNGQYNFHLRQAFGQLGNTYGGYGYSAFMDADALPDTLDFAGPGGQLFLLQPSIHQAFHLGKSSSLTVSVEKPDSEVSTINENDPVRGTQQLPDVVVAARTEHDWGHVQGSVVARQLGYTNGTRNDHAFGGGVALTGTFNVTDRGSNNDLVMFSGSWGKGIAHFISDTGASGLDAAVDAQGQLHALDAWGAYAAYTHYWNKDWRSNLVYGVAQAQRSNLLASTAFRESSYGALNLIWSPFATLTMGVEVLYGRLEQQSGAASNNMRIQGSLQYSFVR
ncbi:MULTISPECIES: DcaP family trimeric outer membrane transporter [Dyella]|nr:MULTISPECIES: DcaP family trimeric outer membrane transporter [Dyella]